MKRFLTSFGIFLFLWLPVFSIGLFAVAYLLRTSWDGKTTWFGNYLYGREGNSHTPKNPSLWQQWKFLALRNPVSNFSKFALSKPKEFDAWLIEKKWWRVGVLYGWKLSDPRLPGKQRPFVFRPWVKRG